MIYPETVYIDNIKGVRADVEPESWNLRIQFLNEKKQWIWAYEIYWSKLYKDAKPIFAILKWDDEAAEWQDTFHRFLGFGGVLKHIGVDPIPDLYDKWEAYVLMDKMSMEAK